MLRREHRGISVYCVFVLFIKKGHHKCDVLFLELIVGLEPTTCALRMRCSTN